MFVARTMCLKFIFIVLILNVIFFIIRHQLLYLRFQMDAYRRYLLTMAVGKEHWQRCLVPTTHHTLLNAYYLSNQNTQKCIIYFHSSTLGFHRKQATIQFLHNYASVFTFDRRCEGLSTGECYQSHFFDLTDAVHIYRYVLHTLKVTADNIIFFSEYNQCIQTLHLTAELSKMNYFLPMVILHYPPNYFTFTQKLAAFVGKYAILPPVIPHLKLIVGCNDTRLNTLNNVPIQIIHLPPQLIDLSANDQYIYYLAQLFKT